MSVRKHLVLVVGGGVSLVLLIAAVIVLLRVNSRYGSVRDELAQQQRRLERLQARTPYPSPANVETLRTNIVIEGRFFTNLYTRLAAEQIEAPVDMEPAQFPLLMERVIRGLINKAAEAGIRLPENFAFGFDRYAQGELPDAADIPRLVVQVKTMERLCDLLYAAHIAGLEKVERQVFEKTGPREEPNDPRRAIRTAAPEPEQADLTDQAPDSDGLLTRERFTLSFTGGDPALWDVLNSLADSPMFAVVNTVTLESDDPGLRTPRDWAKLGAGGGADPRFAASRNPAPTEANTVPMNRDERIAAGREVIRNTLTVDVYRFPGLQAREGSRP